MGWMEAKVWKCLNLSVFSSSYFCWLFYMQHSVVRACHFDTRRRCCVILSLDAFCNSYKLDHNQPNKQFDGRFDRNPRMKIIYDEHRGLLLPEQWKRKSNDVIFLFKIFYLSTENCCCKFARIEDAYNFPYEFMILTVWNISFETNVRKIWFRCYMNCKIMTIR